MKLIKINKTLKNKIKNKKMKHKDKIKKILFITPIIIILLLISISLIFTLFIPSNLINEKITEKPFGNTQLLIPELIDARIQNNSIHLTIQKGEKEFYNGIKSETYGYNQNFLGPTILTHNGDDLNMSYDNKIEIETTIHKHGLHIQGSVDGGPQNKIYPNTPKTEILEIRQEASTNWYHPHIMGETAAQVHKGLAGMLIVKDNLSENYNLPNKYGINDIPLIIQDRQFVNGKMEYTAGLDEESFIGDTIIINGDINPELKVPKGLVRLRFLNGANARILTLKFSDNRQFTKIATEGGFLDNSLPITEMIMATGERNEILVDFSDGKQVYLLTGDNEGLDGQELLNLLSVTKNVKILKISVDESLPTNNKQPQTKLNNIKYHNENQVKVIRTFNLGMGGEGGEENNENENQVQNQNITQMMTMDMATGQMMTINGVSMDMNVINEKVKLGDLEKWIINSGEGVHPFHLHGASFQIISQDGLKPKQEDKGWKDVVLVQDSAEILVKFDFVATKENPYMYHCHILEHEDMGMMGQFTVQ